MKEILDALGKVKEKFIAEAAPKEHGQPRRLPVLRTVMAGVMILLFAGGAIAFFLNMGSSRSGSAAEQFGFTALEKLPDYYTIEQAIADGCVVRSNDGEITNREKIDEFDRAVVNGEKAFMRSVQQYFSAIDSEWIDGIEIRTYISDISADGKGDVNITTDASRSNDGGEKIRTMTLKVLTVADLIEFSIGGAYLDARYPINNYSYYLTRIPFRWNSEDSSVAEPYPSYVRFPVMGGKWELAWGLSGSVIVTAIGYDGKSYDLRDGGGRNFLESYEGKITMQPSPSLPEPSHTPWPSPSPNIAPVEYGVPVADITEYFDIQKLELPDKKDGKRAILEYVIDRDRLIFSTGDSESASYWAYDLNRREWLFEIGRCGDGCGIIYADKNYVVYSFGEPKSPPEDYGVVLIDLQDGSATPIPMPEGISEGHWSYGNGAILNGKLYFSEVHNYDASRIFVYDIASKKTELYRDNAYGPYVIGDQIWYMDQTNGPVSDIFTNGKEKITGVGYTVCVAGGKAFSCYTTDTTAWIGEISGGAPIFKVEGSPQLLLLANGRGDILTYVHHTEADRQPLCIYDARENKIYEFNHGTQLGGCEYAMLGDGAVVMMNSDYTEYYLLTRK